MCAPLRTNTATPPNAPLLTDYLRTASGDTGIHCGRCRYNLTGLTVPRCPECGAEFDQTIDPPFSLRLEHVLLAINAFAILMYALLLGSVPLAGNGRGDAEAAVVVAMLAPLQWVLALAALIAGLHGIKKTGRNWRLLTGIVLPALAAAASLISIFIR